MSGGTVARFEVQGRKWRNWAKLAAVESEAAGVAWVRAWVKTPARLPYVDVRIVEVKAHYAL